MTQDFSQKMVMILKEDLASWQLTNVVGHLGAYLGNKIKEPFSSDGNFVVLGGKSIPRNSQYPIIAFSATDAELKAINQQSLNPEIEKLIFIQEMIDYSDDEKLADYLKTVDWEDLAILGIGLFGNKEELKLVTQKLKLWK